MDDSDQRASALEAGIDQAKRLLQQGAFTKSVDVSQALLVDHPDDIDLLYLLAVAQRYAGRADAAKLTLAALLDIEPAHARGWQELGHGRRAGGDADGAIEAFDRAVAANPALVASWRALAELNMAAGRAEAEAIARNQLDWLSGLPPELVSVASFTHEGKLHKAEKLCRHFLQTNGHHLEAMRMLAELGSRFQVLDEAEFILESAVALEPEFHPGRFDYVNILHKRQKFQKALEQAAILREKAPGVPHFDMLYANQNLAVGNFDAALAVYDALFAARPDNHQVSLTRGHALKTLGRQGEAVTAYRHAYASKPDFGDAYWSLANLKTYRFIDDEIAAMRRAEADRSINRVDRYHLCFALGKALEDRGDHAAAFGYYDTGNRLKREELRYDAARIDAEMAAQKTWCTPALFAAKAGSGAAATDPIFIVGLPRAGSTLLEQILASHSAVEGTSELPNILALAHRLDGRRRVDEEARYPGNLGDVSIDELTGFGEAYLRDTAIYRTGKPFFIDKMPNNFRHIGLIHLILPNARIIDARRDPMGCCFSNFKQLFAEGQDFSYGLSEIGRYYRGYLDLMQHWDDVLPGKVLHVQYEDVVADLETQVRRMLDFCSLPFEPACVNFHETDRAVRTASSEQVRQPIFRSGLDQWENFEAFLAPLRAALEPEQA
jgi:tetratricopeptide (TPR) repeat protein